MLFPGDSARPAEACVRGAGPSNRPPAAFKRPPQFAVPLGVQSCLPAVVAAFLWGVTVLTVVPQALGQQDPFCGVSVQVVCLFLLGRLSRFYWGACPVFIGVLVFFK